MLTCKNGRTLACSDITKTELKPICLKSWKIPRFLLRGIRIGKYPSLSQFNPVQQPIQDIIGTSQLLNSHNQHQPPLTNRALKDKDEQREKVENYRESWKFLSDLNKTRNFAAHPHIGIYVAGLSKISNYFSFCILNLLICTYYQHVFQYPTNHLQRTMYVLISYSQLPSSSESASGNWRI